MERLPHAQQQQRSVTISSSSFSTSTSTSTSLSSSPSVSETTIAVPSARVIYFVVGNQNEVAKFDATTTSDLEVKELFRCAAEAGPNDILKLYDVDGHLLNISTKLSSNTPTSRYRLQVVAADVNNLILNEIGPDLDELVSRISDLEQQLRTECDELPPAIKELKQQVNEFRKKLENSEELCFLGFFKQLPEPLPTGNCRPIPYRRKNDSDTKIIGERFIKIGNTELSDRVKHWLRLPTFDSRPWEDEEVLLLLQQMFLDLNLCSRFGIDLPTLQRFLFETYKHYNEVPFHNFRHCFCVAQMMYTIIWATNLQMKIGDLEILILLVSSICHDLDHPGFNNIYQINAKTELALRYNDISPLENHHCSVAFRILSRDECNIFRTFSDETYRQVREGIIRCILATDMARHNEILSQFKQATPEFDFSNRAHLNLLTMVLIKVADISNEARPMDVAEPWLDRLLEEFFKQSDAEKLEGLPVTPFMDREKITKPSSQCSFIGLVLLPLFEALGDLLTDLQELIVQPVRDALDYYRRLNEATKEERLHRKSVVAELLCHPALARSSVGCPQNLLQRQNSPDGSSGSDGINVPKSVSNHSVKSRKSISFRSRSRSTDEEIDQLNDNVVLFSDEEQNLTDLIEDSESGDSETATEVEVSEKALKFKISTEGHIQNTGRKSYPGSRKGSRERTQLLTSELGTMKDRGKFITALSFDGRLTSKHPTMDMNESIEMLKKFHGRGPGGRGCSGVNSPVSGKSVDFLENDEIKEYRHSILKMTEISKENTKLDSAKVNEPPETILRNARARKDENNVNLVENNVKNLKGLKGENEEGFLPRIVNVVVKCESGMSEDEMVGESVVATPSHEAKPSRSFLARLRQFTDRFNLSLESKNSKPSPQTGGDVEVVDQRADCTSVSLIAASTSKNNGDKEPKKASTLPKTKRPSEGSKKGWRAFIVGKELAANSLTIIPTTSSAAVTNDQNSTPPSHQGSIKSVKKLEEPSNDSFVNI